MTVFGQPLKNRLSDYLRRVQAGEEVIITSHGRPVARLVPAVAEQEGRLGPEELLRRLQAMPGVRLGQGGKPEGAKHPIKAISSNENTNKSPRPLGGERSEGAGLG